MTAKISHPKIGDGAAVYFFRAYSQNVGPGIVVVFAFPSVVEILELLIAVVHLGLFVIPEEETGRVIRARVESVRHQQRVSRKAPVVVAHEGSGENEHDRQWCDNVLHTSAKRLSPFSFPNEPPKKPRCRGNTEEKSLIGTAVGEDSDSEAQ